MMDRQPQALAGCRILVGRARHQASALSAGLRRHGAEILEIPFIEIRPPHSFEPLDSALNKLHSYDWLILTSVNGVEAMFNRLQHLNIVKTEMLHLRLAAIGPATKKSIEKHGLTVHTVPKEYVAESVVESLRKEVAGKNILLVRAKIARDVIPRELSQLGAHVDVVEAYETVIPESSRTRLGAVMNNPGERPHVITFTSSSSVRNFAALLAGTRIEDGIKLASIGPVTSATLRELNFPVDIEAAEYTIPGLIQAILTHYRSCQ